MMIIILFFPLIVIFYSSFIFLDIYFEKKIYFFFQSGAVYTQYAVGTSSTLEPEKELRQLNVQFGSAFGALNII